MLPTAPWYRLPATNALQNVVIIGGGLAGCHSAFELAKRGHHVTLCDANSEPAMGASGNNAGILKPFVTRADSAADQFYQRAFHYVLSLLASNPGLAKAAAFEPCGVLQLLERSYPQRKGFTACSLQDASDIAGTTVDSEAIFFPDAGWLNPAALCKALLEHDNIETRWQCTARGLNKITDGWQIITENKGSFECQTLIIANGYRLNQFDQTSHLPIIPAKGQTSQFQLKGQHALNTVVTGKHYAIPTQAGVHVGATFVRGLTDQTMTKTGHHANRKGLQQLLPAIETQTSVQSGFCGIRATTPDRLPVIGPAPVLADYASDYALIKHGLPLERFADARYHRNLYVIGGFGSRGIVTAAYAATLLAQFLSGRSVGLSKQSDDHLDQWHTLCHPARFLVRALKRGNSVFG